MSGLPFDPSSVNPGASDPGLVDPFQGMSADEYGAAAAAGQAGGPSAAEQEQMRQYMAQLRGAPITSVVAQALQLLLDAAQVKLGRKDARMSLDLVELLKTEAAAYLEPELVEQLDQVLPQLKMGQVEAESQIASAKAQGQYSDAQDPNDLDSYDGLADAPPPAAPSEPKAASRLWTPGV